MIIVARAGPVNDPNLVVAVDGSARESAAIGARGCDIAACSIYSSVIDRSLARWLGAMPSD